MRHAGRPSRRRLRRHGGCGPGNPQCQPGHPCGGPHQRLQWGQALHRVRHPGRPRGLRPQHRDRREAQSADSLTRDIPPYSRGPRIRGVPLGRVDGCQERVDAGAWRRGGGDPPDPQGPPGGGSLDCDAGAVSAADSGAGARLTLHTSLGVPAVAPLCGGGAWLRTRRLRPPCPQLIPGR